MVRKFIPLVFVALFLFCLIGCAKETQETEVMEGPQFYSVIAPEIYKRSAHGGIYYPSDYGALFFYDYEVGEEAIVCTKVNCTHEPWEETTSEEDRCDAFIYAHNLFVRGESLYYFGRQDNEKISLYQSNLDLTDKEKICEIELVDVGNVVVTDTHIYGCGMSTGRGEVIDEAAVYIEKPVYSIFGIEISSGKVEMIGENISEYANYVTLKGMIDDRLVYEHHYTKEDVIKATLEERQDEVPYYWALRTISVTDHETTTVVDESLGIYRTPGFLHEDRYIVPEVISEKEGEYGPEPTAMDILEIQIETKEAQIIASTTECYQWFDHWIFYEDVETREWKRLDLNTNELESGDYQFLENFIISNREGDRLFGVFQSQIEGNYEDVYILKEDVLEGNDNINYISD